VHIAREEEGKAEKSEEEERGKELNFQMRESHQYQHLILPTRRIIT
jgi:hypothetical protein